MNTLGFKTIRHGLAWIASACLLPAATVQANTYSVGSLAPCTHATVQDALSAAAATPSATQHLIQLTTGIYAVPNGLFLHNPVAAVRIAGGYASCGGAQGANTRTVLDATGGADGTVLDIRNFAAESRLISLDRLDIVGGTGETGIGASSEGAGLELRGSLGVFLTFTRVRTNRAFRAAGVLIQGGPGFVLFNIGQGSSVSENVADTDGGGVWCIDQGYVELFNGGTIELNEAGRDGGGVWLGERCDFRMLPSLSMPNAVNILANNRAGTTFGGRGGGVFYQASQSRTSAGPIDVSGTPAAPAFVVGNQALRVGTVGGLGGVMFLEGTGASRLAVRLNNALMINNSAQRAGSALSVRRGIDLTVRADGERCTGAFGFGLCSAVVGADTVALEINEFLGAPAAVQPRVTVERTRFTGNSGDAIIDFAAFPSVGSSLRVDTSVFDANNVDFLIVSSNDTAVRYSTVIGNTLNGNGSLMPAVVHTASGSFFSVDLQGSIIWQPGIKLLSNLVAPNLVQATHGGCLLANDLTGVVNPGQVRTSNPQLSADFTPALTSPAVDVCDVLFIVPRQDAYGVNRPVDRVEVANALGAHDLGAVEFPPPPPPDALFANGFE